MYYYMRIPKPKTNVSCGNDSRSAIKPESLRQDEAVGKERERDENKLRIQPGESGRAAQFLPGGGKGEPMDAYGRITRTNDKAPTRIHTMWLVLQGFLPRSLLSQGNARRQIVPAYATRLAGFPPESPKATPRAM
jgi:hypothetical protein